MSVPAELYLQTVRTLFGDDALAAGRMRWRGGPVDPAAIRDTGLMTVEGGRDDISGHGQTRVAHDLCSQIPCGRRLHHKEPDVGHLGMFCGRRWRASVLPRLRRFIRDNALHRAG
jgi:poly(3-hydroxybutyrate) depolymerase